MKKNEEEIHFGDAGDGNANWASFMDKLERKGYTCPVCGRYFPTESELDQHLLATGHWDDVPEAKGAQTNH